VDLYMYSFTRVYGVLLNELSAGTNLPVSFVNIQFVSGNQSPGFPSPHSCNLYLCLRRVKCLGMLAVLKSEIVPLNLTWRWWGGQDLNYEHPVIETHGLRTYSTRTVNLDSRRFNVFRGLACTRVSRTVRDQATAECPTRRDRRRLLLKPNAVEAYHCAISSPMNATAYSNGSRPPALCKSVICTEQTLFSVLI
jgi:hypothetical protein